MTIMLAMTVLTIAGWIVGVLALVAVGIGAQVALKRYRRSRFAEYDFQVKSFYLERDGHVEYAQWLHPKEKPKSVSQTQVMALRRFIRAGDTVIDIGAHTGDTTVHYALAAGAAGCTLALEPNPYVFKVLAKNAGLNRHKTNIVPLNFAATETDGFFTFHYSDGAYCNGGFLDKIEFRRHAHRQKLDVQGRHLETFLRQKYAERLARLSFVKIDTEGYDRFVIASMLSLLREFQPVVVCEVYRRLTRAEREAQFDLLASAGYECYRQVEGADLVGELVKRDELTSRPHFDLVALPRGRRGQARSA